MPQIPVDHFTVPPMGKFGAWRASGNGHQGVDLYAARGTPIYAAGPGRVISVAYSGDNTNRNSFSARIGFGHNVTVQHDAGYIAVYCHMDRTPLVVYNQRVNDGGRRTQLGVVGDSGNAWAVGTHCHLQTSRGGRVFDPMTLFPATALAGGGYALLPDEKVRKAQQQLATLNYNVGDDDGYRGQRTIAALTAFQKAAGLKPDGILGPNTTTALAAAIRNREATLAAAKLARETSTMLDTFWDTNGTGYVGTPLGSTGLPSMQYMTLFRRRVAALRSGKEETFLRAEVEMMESMLVLISNARLTGVKLDVDKLAKAINAELSAAGIDVAVKDIDWGDSVDKSVADAVAAAVAAAVPKITSSLLRQQGEALAAAGALQPA